eukprot:TRINITY_DN27036_c0_g1_i1.p1 TRINITY_DN27036_c0_g1~~TRINITY_DN27036_c0_g1_i1.p1  ORF type:complete len:301 (+),score=39.68 TRINITY_DN27036_c0_g1_i1:131-1033(+)
MRASQRLFVLASIAWITKASDTCPSGVPGCQPELNDCRICHPSCLYCQNIGEAGTDGVCGPQDCLQCLHGYRFVELYEDGTGECSDQPAIYKSTCPEGQPHCSPENLCETCHPTCRFCQGESQTCGVKDCVTCQPGLIHHPIYSDESGECLPPGVKLEAHELTCPEDVAGCYRDNRCTECHSSCETCQSLTTITGRCDETDCYTCPNGHRLEPVKGNTGRCVPSSKVRKLPDQPLNDQERRAERHANKPDTAVRHDTSAEQAASAGSSWTSFALQMIMAGAALFLANKAGLFRAVLRSLA